MVYLLFSHSPIAAHDSQSSWESEACKPDTRARRNAVNSKFMSAIRRDEKVSATASKRNDVNKNEMMRDAVLSIVLLQKFQIVRAYHAIMYLRGAGYGEIYSILHTVPYTVYVVPNKGTRGR